MILAPLFIPRLALEKIANRIFTELVLAGLLIASSSLLQYWRRLGLVLITIAAGLGLWMVATILVSDRKKPGQARARIRSERQSPSRPLAQRRR